MKLEKVYDELYGMIEDLKKKVAALSGGDDVTITPALESGTKIADYSIGEDTGSLYAPAPYTPISYSTEEQNTGLTWIDGSEIYVKTISCGALPAAGTDKSVAHGITDFAALVKCECMAWDSTHSYGLMIPFANTSVNTQANCGVDTTNINLWSGFSNPADYAVYATVYYIKSSPEPENNTKKRRTK